MYKHQDDCKKTVVILLAGGIGKRFAQSTPKQFQKYLTSDPIIIRTIKQIIYLKPISAIIIVVHKDWIEYTQHLLATYDFPKIYYIVEGGLERHDSIQKGYDAIKINKINDFSNIIIQDSVRPLIDENDYLKLIDNIVKHKIVVYRTKAIYDVATFSACDDLIEIIPKEIIYTIHCPIIIDRFLYDKMHLLPQNLKINLGNCILKFASYMGEQVHFINIDIDKVLKITYSHDIR